jgi:peptidoglycan hydrolase-like protein with peptidoglycan-binding domain
MRIPLFHFGILPGFVMRSVLSATFMLAALGLAQAQTLAPAKPVTTIPIRPTLQKPEDTAGAMSQAERLALQSDLAWVGQYNGAITGDVSERMVTSIKEFQKARGGKPTGVLNPQERGTLADTAKRKQESVGWKIQTDPGTGVRLGIPTKLVPQQASDANGTKWTSPTGTIQVQLAQGSRPHRGTTRRAREERTGTHDRLHRGEARLLRAVRPAGAKEILSARHLQGR